jgi:hypothetical protein
MGYQKMQNIMMIPNLSTYFCQCFGGGGGGGVGEGGGEECPLLRVPFRAWLSFHPGPDGRAPPPTSPLHPLPLSL